jgi:hypothetical protein
MPWGSCAEAAPHLLTLRLDRVRWPSSPASYKYRGRTRNRGGNFGTDIDEQQRFLEGEKEKKRRDYRNGTLIEREQHSLREHREGNKGRFEME